MLAGLSLSTNYYVRAYATNSIGTAYGNEISFSFTSGTVIQFTITGSSSWSVPEGVGSGEVLVVGGGGGGGSEPGFPAASGGTGGGGNGSNTSGGNGADGMPNTGGGGGGTRSNITNETGGHEGSGIIVVRY
ncbi:MAG: hypothetical protein IT223_05245 [Crocinitomicaceae bacterium]|nr:hypothetical protein [Crocinitomicaceae bacterium]